VVQAIVDGCCTRWSFMKMSLRRVEAISILTAPNGRWLAELRPRRRYRTRDATLRQEKVGSAASGRSACDDGTGLVHQSGRGDRPTGESSELNMHGAAQHQKCPGDDDEGVWECRTFHLASLT
jgi:hypothetical protein